MALRPNPTLPDEVINSEILPRLPVKTIGRFRCLSKPWRSFLSTPKFSRSHLQRHINGPDEQDQVVMATGSGDGSGFRMITFRRDGSKNLGVAKTVSHLYDSGRRIFQLGPSCHGLVLLILEDAHSGGKFCNVLLNPVTREAVEFESLHNWGLRFCFGLGYDSVSDDYKVVSIPYNSTANVNVYSLKSKTWRRVANIPYGCSYRVNLETRDRDVNYSCHGLHGMFLNSHVYWRRVYYDDVKDANIFVLVAFSLGSEEFEEVLLPRCMNGQMPFEICLVDGFLGLVFREARVLHFWVMKEHGVQDSWTNVGIIKYPKRRRVDGQTTGSKFRVVCRLHGVDDDSEFVLQCDLGKFFSYNLTSGKWRFLDVDDLPVRCHYELIGFKGSLVSPIDFMV